MLNLVGVISREYFLLPKYLSHRTLLLRGFSEIYGFLSKYSSDIPRPKLCAKLRMTLRAELPTKSYLDREKQHL